MLDILKLLLSPGYRRGKAKRRLEKICRECGTTRAMSKRLAFLTFSKNAKRGTIAVPSR